MSDRRPSEMPNICRICLANGLSGRTSTNHANVCLVCSIMLHTATEVCRAIKACVEFPEGYIINDALAAMYQASPDHTSICNDCIERHPERVAAILRKRRSGGRNKAFAALIAKASLMSFADDRASRISTGKAVTTCRRTLDYPTMESVEAALAWLECRGLQGTGKNVQVVLGVEYTDKVRHYVKMLRAAEAAVG